MRFFSLCSRNQKRKSLSKISSHTLAYPCETGLNEEDISAAARHLLTHPEIHEISLVNNYLTNQDILPLFQNQLHHIKKLTLSVQDLTDKGLAHLLEAMPNLVAIDLSYNGLSDETACLLAKSSSLESINLNHNQVGNAGLLALIQNTHVKNLSIAGNAFSITEPLKKAILANTTLQALELANDNIPTQVRHEIEAHVQKNASAASMVP